MYHPYFRGKQYELITIRETASTLADAGFIPIIEPVKDVLGGLRRALDAVLETDDGRAIVIVNPNKGDHAADGGEIEALLAEPDYDVPRVIPAILVCDETTLAEAAAIHARHARRVPALVHARSTNGPDFAAALRGRDEDAFNIFIESRCREGYRRHFSGTHRVIVTDGFTKCRNRDYVECEFFTDKHQTFREANMTGFGDFLIVGDQFSETGGPAYAVALHLTFINPDDDDNIYCYHFVSDDQDAPGDMAQKFSQAVAKLIAKADDPRGHIFDTPAVRGFRALHTSGHFPGLGTVKKLSMSHHIQMLSRWAGHHV